MGWIYSASWPTKSAMIEHCTGPEMMGDKLTTLAKAIRGNALWTVIEYTSDGGSYPKGHRAILCFLLGSDVKRGGGWGYKDMDESMGPVEVSCPVKFLDMVPDPGGYATEWRAKVRAAAAKRAVKIAVGDTLVLRTGCTPSSLVCTSVTPLRAAAHGITYRIRRGLIDRVEKEVAAHA
jgi:hypothetical protein